MSGPASQWPSAAPRRRREAHARFGVEVERGDDGELALLADGRRCGRRRGAVKSAWSIFIGEQSALLCPRRNRPQILGLDRSGVDG